MGDESTESLFFVGLVDIHFDYSRFEELEGVLDVLDVSQLTALHRRILYRI